MTFGLTAVEAASLVSAGVGAYSATQKGGGGGGATQTVNKAPWSEAVPWLKSNLQTGQNLQNYYQANPFNAVQQNAYGNLFAGNDYINQVTPGLLSQLSQQGGFDRNNPMARPPAFNFMAAPMPAMQNAGGLLGASTGTMNTNPGANPFAPTGMLGAAPAAAPAPAQSATGPTFADANAYWQNGVNQNYGQA